MVSSKQTPTFLSSRTETTTCASRYPMWHRSGVTLEASTPAPTPEAEAAQRGLAFFLMGDPVPSPRREASEGLTLRLALAQPVRPAQPIGVSLSMSNTSGAPLFVMRPLHCSFTHRCQPTYDIYLRDDETLRVYRWDYDGPVGGAIEGLTPGNMVALQPGETQHDVLEAWEGVDGLNVRRHGRYTLWMVYRLCGITQPFASLSEDERRGQEPGWFQSLAHGVYVSNGVSFTVE